MAEGERSKIDKRNETMYWIEAKHCLDKLTSATAPERSMVDVPKTRGARKETFMMMMLWCVGLVINLSEQKLWQWWNARKICGFGFWIFGRIFLDFPAWTIDPTGERRPFGFPSCICKHYLTFDPSWRPFGFPACICKHYLTFDPSSAFSSLHSRTNS